MPRPATGGVVGPHRVRAGFGERLRVGGRLHAGFPVNTGARFSRNALTPSAKSARAARLALRVALDIELLVKRVAGGRGHRAAGQHQRMRRLRGEMGGELLRLDHQRLVFDDTPDHAPRLGACRIDRLGEHRHRARPRALADDARQQVRAAAIGHQPDLGERLR